MNSQPITPASRPTSKLSMKSQEPFEAFEPFQMTAVKQREAEPVPSPTAKKIMLFGNTQKHLFPLVRDSDIGIAPCFQNIVIESYNDDDKKTSSTQLEKGMAQTLSDLYEIIGMSKARTQK